jgi:Ca-activated chloride channel family protein
MSASLPSARKRALVLLGAIFVVATAAGVGAGQQGPTFRGGTQAVSLFVTVNDASGRLVPDLIQEEFEVLDNGRPQPIVLFDSSVQPITVVVMLDTSGSMTAAIPLLLDAAEQFLIRLLPDDKGKVGAFNDMIEVSAHFTGDRDELVAASRDLDYGNGTRLYDALAVGLDELQGIEGRRVILVFTDGEDTASRVGPDRIVDRARVQDVMVYAIGLESQYFDGSRMVRSRPDGRLKRIAEETGGGYFELTKTADLAPTFTRVAQELHSQYLVGFVPTELDGRVHKLVTRVKRPGMTARTRRSYVADPEKLNPVANETRQADPIGR